MNEQATPQEKHFVLDTNVLLNDSQALFTFGSNTVVIPIYVIEEIDNFKKELSELGRNAREVGRHLDLLREKGSLAEGVTLDNKGLLRVAITGRQLPTELRMERNMDSKILAVALDERDKYPDAQVIFITKDTNLRVRADAVGLISQNYDTERTEVSELYSGHNDLELSAAEVDAYYDQGGMDVPEGDFTPNEFFVLRDRNSDSHTALGRIDHNRERIVPLGGYSRDGVWGIRPRNKEQAFALDLLLDDSVQLITLVGKAGTGKTLLAIAAGLQKVTEETKYQRMLVSRPIFPLGKDIGYLPGTVEEKLNPWMQPIFDNIEFLMNLTEKDRKNGRSYKELLDLGMLQIEPLTYIRGRSIPNQYMIVDEAQNLTPHEVKTIITRAGDNTKIVLTGDPYQIDHPYVDATNNGLVSIVNKFRGERLAGHITLSKGERSPLAELASNIL